MRRSGRYHHATVHPAGPGLKRLVMAGQVGIRPDGTLPGDLGGRSSRPMTTCSQVLASEGMSAADLVKITYFTTDKSPEALETVARHSRAQARRRQSVLDLSGDRRPRGPDLKVEIEGEAVGEGVILSRGGTSSHGRGGTMAKCTRTGRTVPTNTWRGSTIGSCTSRPG
jgi:enamine deaminase RidA (YjgF/YER057c/UK114 family)